MLVLSRKPGERIQIGDGVVVTLVRIGPNAVRLGIAAPKDLDIYRLDKDGVIQAKKLKPESAIA